MPESQQQNTTQPDSATQPPGQPANPAPSPMANFQGAAQVTPPAPNVTTEEIAAAAKFFGVMNQQPLRVQQAQSGSPIAEAYNQATDAYKYPTTVPPKPETKAKPDPALLKQNEDLVAELAEMKADVESRKFGESIQQAIGQKKFVDENAKLMFQNAMSQNYELTKEGLVRNKITGANVTKKEGAGFATLAELAMGHSEEMSYLFDTGQGQQIRQNAGTVATPNNNSTEYILSHDELLNDDILRALKATNQDTQAYGGNPVDMNKMDQWLKSVGLR